MHRRPCPRWRRPIWPVVSVTWRTSSPRPKIAANAGVSPSMKPSETFAARPEMLPRRKCAQRGAAPAQHAGDAGCTDGRIQAVQHEPVFHPAGKDAGGKQQHAGKGGKQQRWGQQVQRIQRLHGCNGIDGGIGPAPGDELISASAAGNTSPHVAQHRRHLRAHQLRDLVHEGLHVRVVVQPLSLAAMAAPSSLAAW